MTSQSVSANETVSRLSFPLSPKPLPPKRMAQNPYMPQSDSCVHNDWYSSDVIFAPGFVRDGITPVRRWDT